MAKNKYIVELKNPRRAGQRTLAVKQMKEYIRLTLALQGFKSEVIEAIIKDSKNWKEKDGRISFKFQAPISSKWKYVVGSQGK